MSEKIRRKTLAQDVFWHKMKLDGVKTLIKKYQCEILNFVDLCSGVGIVWSTTTRTLVSDATAVTFCVKIVLTHENSIQCQETSSESGLLHTYFYIHEHLIIM